MFQPIIKWSGSKRTQAFKIISLFPDYNRYYEPFVGGGSIAYALSPNRAVCGDICEPLVELWEVIKNSPDALIDTYKNNWNRLQEEGYLVYYEIRERFNRNQDPHDLFFLSRTCVNGLIRFNKDGQFNNSLHHTRKGINPDRLYGILKDWSQRIRDTEFRKGDYRETTYDISSGDFIYLDPPYFNTKGRYYGTINYNDFISFLEQLNSKNIKFALSFDGKREDVDYTIDLPKELYKRHIFLESGNSSFKKVMDKTNEKVFESLYLNY